jgi:hypothetical protein
LFEGPPPDPDSFYVNPAQGRIATRRPVKRPYRPAVATAIIHRPLAGTYRIFT